MRNAAKTQIAQNAERKCRNAECRNAKRRNAKRKRIKLISEMQVQNAIKTQQNAKRFHMVNQVSNWARFMMKTKCPNKLVTLSLTAENWSMLPLKNH